MAWWIASNGTHTCWCLEAKLQTCQQLQACSCWHGNYCIWNKGWLFKWQPTSIKYWWKLQSSNSPLALHVPGCDTWLIQDCQCLCEKQVSKPWASSFEFFWAATVSSQQEYILQVRTVANFSTCEQAGIHKMRQGKLLFQPASPRMSSAGRQHHHTRLELVQLFCWLACFMICTIIILFAMTVCEQHPTRAQPSKLDRRVGFK